MDSQRCLTKHPNKFFRKDEQFQPFCSRGGFNNTHLVTVKPLHPPSSIYYELRYPTHKDHRIMGYAIMGSAKKGKKSSMAAFINISCGSLLHILAVCFPVCSVYKILGHLFILLNLLFRCRSHPTHDAGTAWASR